MNSKSSNQESHWLPCEDGAIQSAAESVRALRAVEQRRRFLKATVTGSVCLAGAAFAGWSLFASNDKRRAVRGNRNYPGGISCAEVIRLMPEYVAQSLTNENLTNSIAVHLADCKHCRGIHHSMTHTA
ncbi:hypothetical protein [Mariniblastus fucicola]|uniref:Zinc-finger domain-containing protein n=1 Tax=Mariniblastus fucicola TaxID=980251 RepID=A0A5B9PI42_9BACT|nr:hypothetical protein [Mariniblastus fucicola]QEG22491.1 hypothetical protein MFFC18_23720 [Mariniblastus fucicola]